MEAIESADRGYERNQIPCPGPVSGYCLGKDPYLLELAFEEIAKKRGFGSVWFYGRRANDWLIEKIVTEVKGKNILVAGLSFKENIDDYRYSHGIDIIRMLLAQNYNVIVCDPFLNTNNYTKLPEDIIDKVKGFTSLEDALNEKLDTIIFTTRHEEYNKFDIKKIPKNVKIIDLWNMFNKQ
jgi:UDP-N-acetyl-D-mannosaminuronate dehydrogenase